MIALRWQEKFSALFKSQEEVLLVSDRGAQIWHSLAISRGSDLTQSHSLTRKELGQSIVRGIFSQGCCSFYLFLVLCWEVISNGKISDSIQKSILLSNVNHTMSSAMAFCWHTFVLWSGVSLCICICICICIVTMSSAMAFCCHTVVCDVMWVFGRFPWVRVGFNHRHLGKSASLWKFNHKSDFWNVFTEVLDVLQKNFEIRNWNSKDPKLIPNLWIWLKCMVTICFGAIDGQSHDSQWTLLARSYIYWSEACMHQIFPILLLCKKIFFSCADIAKDHEWLPQCASKWIESVLKCILRHSFAQHCTLVGNCKASSYMMIMMSESYESSYNHTSEKARQMLYFLKVGDSLLSNIIFVCFSCHRSLDYTRRAINRRLQYSYLPQVFFSASDW